MKKYIIPIGTLLLSGLVHAQLTPTENYIQSRTYLDYNGTQPTKTSETVQYFDGLGRPKQIINVKASPQGKDIVTHIEYDPFGRQVKDYLPVPQSGTLNGAITPNPLANAPGTPYGTEKIYSEKILENSPLDRIQQQIQVGNDWTGKPVKFNYDANIHEDYVRQYETTTTWIDGRTQTALQLNHYFGPSQLYKNTITDEDGNTTIEFKNGRGQLLLSRKVLNATENADTYYVYNEYDQLAFVIPPLASAPTIEPATIENLYYQYRYDGRNRLVEKKLPGKGWEYMAYDKADRLIMTQDANMRPSGKWLFNKYDQYSRIIYTGIANIGAQYVRQQVQESIYYYINNGRPATEERSPTAVNSAGMAVYYTNAAYPGDDIEKILTVNYYDTYPQYSFNPAFPSSIEGEPVLTETPSQQGRSTKGLPVMSLVKNIEDDNWTKNYTYYDTKGITIGSHSINHLGGYTRIESRLDFAGVVQKTTTKHKRLNTDPERNITETFTYDHQNRLLVHKHQVDNNPEEILAQNTYNELSQLEVKKVGGTSPGSPLQTINYQYNIRGWMTKINDPKNLNGKLFGYEIKYQNPEYDSQSSGRFNGNIAEIDWKNSSEDILKRYNYGYDSLNRLKDAFYAEPGAVTPHNGNYDEYLTYDLNGNIRTLKRKAFPIVGMTSTLVDDLDYVYTGNRLNQVIENSMNNTGYEGGNNIISYDPNGNMTDMKDKGIEFIAYNHLNLPGSMSITQTDFFGVSTSYLDYLYRADGVKLRKTFSGDGGKGSPRWNKETDYLDGFQYSYYDAGGGGICLTCRTESAYEEKAYKGTGFPGTITPVWTLDFVPTPEGFYSFAENRYIYQYRDHLGNVRVSFAKNNTGTIDITDTNNYYPFGLNHIDGQISKGKFGGYQSYKYQGQELQETGFYSFKWRNYMPDVGRFFNIDPLAEKFTYNSPYAFAENRVVDGRELEGLEWVASTSGNDITLNYYVKLNNNSHYITNDQMMILANERRDVLVNNLSGKDTDSRNVKVNVIYSDNATISWDYNSYIDIKGMDYSSIPANEVDMAKIIDQTAAGLTDKIGDTQNNRTQINLGNTLFENEVNKFNDPIERKKVAAAGAHEDLHTGGQQHLNRLTDRKSKLYQEQSRDNKNSMNKGYESANTHVTPEQRKQVVDLIINQNQ